MKMPKYQCNRVVEALQISHVVVAGTVQLTFVDRKFDPIFVDSEFYNTFRPVAGGWYCRNKGAEVYITEGAFKREYSSVNKPKIKAKVADVEQKPKKKALKK